MRINKRYFKSKSIFDSFYFYINYVNEENYIKYNNKYYSYYRDKYIGDTRYKRFYFICG